MNLADINTKVDELTKADRTIAYPNANRLINLNIWNQNVVSMILDAQDSSDFDDTNQTGYATINTPLVANQRDYSFGISDGIVEVKRVDVSYDGTTSNRAQALDSSEIEEGTLEGATIIDTNFTQSSPYYDWKYNAIFLYPKPTASTGSVEVEVSRLAKAITLSDLTTGTYVLGFDLNFHPMVAEGMAYEYFKSNKMWDDVKKSKECLAEYEARLRRQFGKKQRDYTLHLVPEYVDYN